MEARLCVIAHIDKEDGESIIVILLSGSVPIALARCLLASKVECFSLAAAQLHRSVQFAQQRQRSRSPTVREGSKPSPC